MSYSQIRLDLPAEGEGWDGVATLVIDRPGKLNALNSAVLDELENALDLLARNESIGGLIITGEGSKAFVAGADIAELAGLSGPQALRFAERGQRVFSRLETIQKPSVAAINGFALGGGLELALCCTFRMAVPGAKLGFPEVKLGLIPGFGGTQRLPRLIGRSKALEMILTGEPVVAEQAMEWGLVDRVVSRESLVSEARAFLRKVMQNAPLAVALAMQAVDAASGTSLEEGLRNEAALFGVAAASEDKAEGTRAFLEKRAPVFLGR